MAGVSGKVVAALATLFSVLVTYGSAGYSAAWQPAKATWYGAPYGFGPDDAGGACGFKNTNKWPFMSMTSCGNEPLFQGGAGCGACYQIRCFSTPECSGQTQTVMITDMNYYPVARYHFDLSGIGFGSMAKYGQTDKLLHRGIIDIQFRRVNCNHGGININFYVVPGSNPVYLAFLVEYVSKAGTVVQVDVQEATGQWTTLRRSWGCIYRLDSNHGPLKGPFNVRIRNDAGQSLTAYKAIPANFQGGTNYYTNIQYR